MLRLGGIMALGAFGRAYPLVTLFGPADTLDPMTFCPAAASL